tara:strand:- start:3271 stop:3444 length:174 start_codon:yes stop_codon:yes gene_type:complete
MKKEKIYKLSKEILIDELQQLIKYIDSDKANQHKINSIRKCLENNIMSPDAYYIWEY